MAIYAKTFYRVEIKDKRKKNIYVTAHPLFSQILMRKNSPLGRRYMLVWGWLQTPYIADSDLDALNILLPMWESRECRCATTHPCYVMQWKVTSRVNSGPHGCILISFNEVIRVQWRHWTVGRGWNQFHRRIHV